MKSPRTLVDTAVALRRIAFACNRAGLGDRATILRLNADMCDAAAVRRFVGDPGCDGVLPNASEEEPS